jgi:uncharacterized RDD family membrane protein YckC
MSDIKYVIAPIGKRFSAQFIDEGLALLVGYFVMLGLAEVLDKGSSIPFLVFCLILLFYTLFADGMFVGQSIGKKLMKLYVVRSDTEEPCTYGRSVLRNITYLLGIFDFIFIFGPTKRRLGDRLAKTKVVMKRLGE